MSADGTKASAPQPNEMSATPALARFKGRLHQADGIIYRAVDFDYETRLYQHARHYDAEPFHQPGSFRGEF